MTNIATQFTQTVAWLQDLGLCTDVCNIIAVLAINEDYATSLMIAVAETDNLHIMNIVYNVVPICFNTSNYCAAVLLSCRSIDAIEWVLAKTPPDKHPESMFPNMVNACRRGDLAMAQRLCERYNCADRLPKSGLLLSAACLSGCIPLVQWLVSKFGGQVHDIQGLVRVACIRGHLALAQWVYKNVQSPPDDQFSRTYVAREIIAPCNHLDVIQWLVKTFGVTGYDLRQTRVDIHACVTGHMDILQWLLPQIGVTNIHNMLDEAVSNGHLEMAKWLYSTFNVQFAPTHALIGACAGGHLNAAKWLVSIAKSVIPLIDVRHSFHNACAHGHFAVAKWLAATFKVKAADVRSKAAILKSVCEYGYLKLLQWLIKTFSLTLKDVNEDIIISAISNNHLDLVKWLFIHFDMQDYHLVGLALEIACQNGDMSFVQWAVATYKQLTANDVSTSFIAACAHDHLSIAQWLHQHFNLTGHVKRMESITLFDTEVVAGWLIDTFELPKSAIRQHSRDMLKNIIFIR